MPASRRTFLISLPALLALACADDFAGADFDACGYDYADEDPIGLTAWAYDETDSIPVPDHLAWSQETP